jgi:hypothetical protein
MFLANGLRLKERIEAGHNRARLYAMAGNNPLIGIIDAQKIRKYVRGDESRDHEKVGVSILKDSDKPNVNIPNPIELSDESFYVDSLIGLPLGRGYDTEYQNLACAILIKLFMPPLKNPKLEYQLNEGLKRVDMIMSNQAEHGFFAGLLKRFGVHAPYIFIECKNYSSDVSDPEVDLLADRYKTHGGRFGILVYCNAGDDKALLKRCQHFLDNRGHIITLNDVDIIRTLKYRMDNIDLDEYLDEKMQQLLLS